MAISVKKFYTGFRTRNYEEFGGSFDIHNVDVVADDILNAIFTVRGERLMMPNYGTRIPLMTFELGDTESIEIIRSDIEQVINNEPRVRLENLDVVPALEKNCLVVIAKLTYIEFMVTKDLYIEVRSQ